VWQAGRQPSAYGNTTTYKTTACSFETEFGKQVDNLVLMEIPLPAKPQPVDKMLDAAKRDPQIGNIVLMVRPLSIKTTVERLDGSKVAMPKDRMLQCFNVLCHGVITCSGTWFRVDWY